MRGQGVDVRVPGSARACIAAYGRSSLGLACGLQAAESSFGLFNALIIHAPSLRLALELLSRFHPLLLDGVRVSLTERLGVTTLRCEFPRLGSSLERGFAEMIVAGIERMLRVFGGTRESVHAVCFEHERPAHHQAYTAAFGGAERFSMGSPVWCSRRRSWIGRTRTRTRRSRRCCVRRRSAG